MKILSHRGYWLSADEKNSTVAFQRSFDQGYGTETDLRDYCGEVVIAHDVATKKNITFEQFLEIYT
jgi:glycerophosphoryl diester phosphodiesterase